MNGSRDVAIGAVLVALTVALHFWGRALAKRRGSRFWIAASWLPVIAMFVPVPGLVLTALALREAFGALQHSDPAQRAQQLSSGIAHAMYYTALGLALSALLYLGTAILFTVGTLRGTRPSS